MAQRAAKQTERDAYLRIKLREAQQSITEALRLLTNSPESL
jgi:hypothetical protein